MATTNLPRSYAIARVSKVERTGDGHVTSTVLAAPKRKKRVSKRYRKADKVLRRLARAQQVASDDFLARHDRANRKKKNGGVKKFVRNAAKAARKGGKKLRIR
ncbi:MAG TPA: hypothetical protein VNQ48_00320 [Microbacteriaceae bacterium]|nr:hypothetical protein [Microbacteriaceae bacterium]